jgi:hypothetical protein
MLFEEADDDLRVTQAGSPPSARMMMLADGEEG